MKDLLRTIDLSPESLALVLERALSLRDDPYRAMSVLRGDTVVLLFEKPSTRTRMSFETAIARLGGNAVFASTTDLQLSRGERLEDTARVGSRYSRAFILRTYRHEDVERFASAATVPVVNALTDRHHPCQSIGDLLTLRAHFGTLAGLTVAYVGAGNNVAHSLMEAAALAGMHVRVASPEAFAVDPAVAEAAREIADEMGGSIELHEDPRAAARDAHAVYTDVWLSMGDDPDQAEARRDALEPYRVDDALMAQARPDAIFMHPLPCRRGQEVSASVVDGPRSVVLDQAENRLHTAGAVLETLLRHELKTRKVR